MADAKDYNPWSQLLGYYPSVNFRNADGAAAFFPRGGDYGQVTDYAARGCVIKCPGTSVS
jgi:hypothetical protein